MARIQVSFIGSEEIGTTAIVEDIDDDVSGSLYPQSQTDFNDWIRNSNGSLSDDSFLLYKNIIFFSILLCVLLAVIIFCLVLTNWLNEIFGWRRTARGHKRTKQRRSMKKALMLTKIENWAPEHDHFPNNVSCVICLDEFETAEVVRRLHCGHVFHVNCIDNWILRMKAACPICKQKLSFHIPNPVTMESEEEENPHPELPNVRDETVILLPDPSEPITGQDNGLPVPAPRDVLLEYYSSSDPELSQGRREMVLDSPEVEVTPLPIVTEIPEFK